MAESEVLSGLGGRLAIAPGIAADRHGSAEYSIGDASANVAGIQASAD
jgi:hypothetical protein